MILFAVFLLSRSCGILKIPYVWCQKRDLNSRPPAYESEVTNNGGILSKKTYTLLKYGKQELFYKKRIKNIMKYRTCFLTSLSLLKGLNSEYICCIFAELKFTSLINKSIYMSIYFTHNITNSILFKIVNRCSYKLIKILYERVRANPLYFLNLYYCKKSMCSVLVLLLLHKVLINEITIKEKENKNEYF